VSAHPAKSIGDRARDAARTVYSFARARYELRAASIGERVRCYGPVRVRGSGQIEVGSRCVFLGGMLPSELVCEDGARLTIGTRGIFNYGISIVAREGVAVGARCRFGSLVHVRDDDGFRRAPVVIEDDVWLAHGAIVEPGARIGRGSVVAAGAVVYGEMPPHTLATGNPAVFAPLGAPSPSPRKAPQGAERRSPRTREGIRTTIIDWLDETRHFGDAERLITNEDLSLRDGGLLDSLGLVQLVLMLEQRYAVSIDRNEVARPGAQSMRAIVDLVASLTGESK
jgi:maltose O-acetyltransferase